MMKTADKSSVFVDTNLLVFASVEEAPLHQIALSTIKNLLTTDSPCWISRQVLREFLVTLTRPQVFSSPLDKKVVLKQISFFEQNFLIAEDNADVSKCLYDLILDFPIGGKRIHDANIVATMLACGIPVLITHNISDFRIFSNLIQIKGIDY